MWPSDCDAALACTYRCWYGLLIVVVHPFCWCHVMMVLGRWTLLAANVDEDGPQAAPELDGYTSYCSNQNPDYSRQGSACSVHNDSLLIFGGASRYMYSNLLLQYTPDCRPGFTHDNNGGEGVEGTKYGDGVCVVCALGTYRAQNDTLCQRCPDGLTTSQKRSTSIDECDVCGPDACSSRGSCTVVGVGSHRATQCVCNFGYSGATCDNAWKLIVIGVVIGVASLLGATIVGCRKMRRRIHREKRLGIATCLQPPKYCPLCSLAVAA